MTTASSADREMARDNVAAMFARRDEAYVRMDADALGADYADDAVIYSPAGGVHQGRDAARMFRALFIAFADNRRRVERVLIDGTRIAEVMTLEGTNLGGLMGMQPSGKQFKVAAVFLYELRGGKIIRERRIYDFTGLLVQIGMLKAKPA